MWIVVLAIAHTARVWGCNPCRISNFWFGKQCFLEDPSYDNKLIREKRKGTYGIGRLEFKKALFEKRGAVIDKQTDVQTDKRTKL